MTLNELYKIKKINLILVQIKELANNRGWGIDKNFIHFDFNKNAFIIDDKCCIKYRNEFIKIISKPIAIIHETVDKWMLQCIREKIPLTKEFDFYVIGGNNFKRHYENDSLFK